jgi:hypothetical protein
VTAVAAQPSLADTRCGGCGSVDVIAILVGTEPMRADAVVGIHTRRGKLLERGTADRFWCAACWPIARRKTA